MTLLFCGSNNTHCVDALKIVFNAGIHVSYVLLSDNIADESLKCLCEENDVEIVYDKADHRLQEGKFDILISFAYQKLIPVYLIQNAGFAVNFHPAPLPRYKGRANTVQALLNGETEWGVTCHFIETSFDTGDIIETRSFVIENPDEITGKELADISWSHCLNMLESVLKRFMSGEKIVGTPQLGDGKYFSMKDLQEAKEVRIEDSTESITRKINALWFPPFEGAYIKIGGVKYYLITDKILNSLD